MLEHDPARAVNDDGGVINLVPILLQAAGGDPHLVLAGQPGQEVGIFARDGQGIPAFGAIAKQRGIKVIISSVRRDAVDATTHEIKSLNYLNSVLAKLEAADAGADDALMLDRNGFVSEATTTNLFIVKHGEIFTPPSTAGILPGVTRKRIIKLARELDYRVIEKGLTPYDVTNADEAFLTGTLSEVVPLVKVRGIEIADGKVGPITQIVLEGFVKVRADPANGLPVYQEAERIVARRQSPRQ